MLESEFRRRDRKEERVMKPLESKNQSRQGLNTQTIFIDAGYIIERQVEQTWILLQSIQGIGFDFFFQLTWKINLMAN